VDTFLTDTFYSVQNDGTELMHDRNMETGERYKNIFELRHIKNKFLIEKMPTLVKNYCLITYDNLVQNFMRTMNRLKRCHLPLKKTGLLFPQLFPQNVLYYKKNKNTLFKKKPNEIPSDVILKKANLHYERVLFSMDFNPK
jgi:hypothetical protein